MPMAQIESTSGAAWLSRTAQVYDTLGAAVEFAITAGNGR
jgi:hypothetical protein